MFAIHCSSARRLEREGAVKGFISFIKHSCSLSVWALVHGNSLKAFPFVWRMAWSTRNAPIAYGLVEMCLKMVKAVEATHGD